MLTLPSSSGNGISAMMVYPFHLTMCVTSHFSSVILQNTSSFLPIGLISRWSKTTFVSFGNGPTRSPLNSSLSWTDSNTFQSWSAIRMMMKVIDNDIENKMMFFIFIVRFKSQRLWRTWLMMLTSLSYGHFRRKNIFIAYTFLLRTLISYINSVFSHIQLYLYDIQFNLRANWRPLEPMLMIKCIYIYFYVRKS